MCNSNSIPPPLSLTLRSGACAAHGGFHAKWTTVEMLGIVDQNHGIVVDFDAFPGGEFARIWQCNDAAHAPVLVANLNAGIGHNPQISVAIKFNRTDFEQRIVETV